MEVLPRLVIFVTAIFFCLFAGCDRDDEITFAQRPKDPAPVVSPASAEAGGALHWTAPGAWRELPAKQMRFATFAVNDANPPTELTVIPLGPESAALGPNVNRWAKELGLSEPPPEKLGEIVKHVTSNGLEIDIIDLTGARERTLAAIVPSGGRVWFFKLRGTIDVVTAQKQNFDAFIQSLHVADDSAAAATATRLAHYQVPAGWSEIPNPTPPRVLALRAGDAEVVVTQFAANNAGTFADNITRWRRQIGLEPPADPNSTPMKEIIVGKDTPAVLLEFHNPANAKRMLVVMASARHDLWFIKMIGPADAVDAQRGNFDAFFKSLDLNDGSQPR